ncbi:MAG: tRNA-dihydrouridine synthase family protein [Euryarchaeota archaeon]|jgi:nifR3 family TIM-barrel protein|nr:tRNA-dihydrouridine synthase family protein [Euryarchaeota archaeon]MBT4982591.1 tRNA-dihydrouridine synthase family protein [Euryarchaeota archaeon]MBT5184424.1 tRNA-dihydrouridine synthase family protein [Euryarchaeota archaeon]
MSAFILPKPGEWDGEHRPLFLAPMSGVTDLAYRLLAKECGADFTITEFTNSTALTRDAATSWKKMETCDAENPFIPQIFGGVIDDMALAAELLSDSADIIDLNFGCPAPKITKICAGAALMGDPQNLVSMCEEVVDRVDIPVTAKMRLGTGQGEINAKEICQELEQVGIQRLCVHGRTLRQRYSGVADWDYITSVVESVELPVIANGDVVDSDSARACLSQTNAAGLMVGRGAIGRPSVFGEIKVGLGWMEEEELPWIAAHEGDWKDLSDVAKQFATRRWCWNRYIELARETTGLELKSMRGHAVSFTKGLPSAKKIRNIMHGKTSKEEFAAATSNFLASN